MTDQPNQASDADVAAAIATLAAAGQTSSNASASAFVTFPEPGESIEPAGAPDAPEPSDTYDAAQPVYETAARPENDAPASVEAHPAPAGIPIQVAGPEPTAAPVRPVPSLSELIGQLGVAVFSGDTARVFASDLARAASE